MFVAQRELIHVTTRIICVFLEEFVCKGKREPTNWLKSYLTVAPRRVPQSIRFLEQPMTVLLAAEAMATYLIVLAEKVKAQTKLLKLLPLVVIIVVKEME